MSAAARYLAGSDIRDRQAARRARAQALMLGALQQTQGGIADASSQFAALEARREAQRARREAQRARREEMAMSAQQGRDIDERRHSMRLHEIAARKAPGAGGGSSGRSSALDRDMAKAARKDAEGKRARAIEDAGKRVAMAQTVGGSSTSRRRADELADRLATEYGMSAADARIQIANAATGAQQAQVKQFQGEEDRDMKVDMAEIGRDRATAALGSDEAKLAELLNQDGPQYDQARAAALNADTSKRRQDLAEKKYRNRPRGSGKPGLPKVNQTAARSLGEGRNAIRQLDRLRKTFEEERINTGFIVGPLQEKAHKYGLAPSAFSTFKSEALLALQSIGRKSEGGKLADADFERYNAALNNTSLDEQDYLRIIETMRRSAVDAYNIERQSYNVTGDDPRFPDIEPSPAASPGGMVRMRDPNTGRTGSVPADRVDAAKAKGFEVVK